MCALAFFNENTAASANAEVIAMSTDEELYNPVITSDSKNISSSWMSIDIDFELNTEPAN